MQPSNNTLRHIVSVWVGCALLAHTVCGLPAVFGAPVVLPRKIVTIQDRSKLQMRRAAPEKHRALARRNLWFPVFTRNNAGQNAARLNDETSESGESPSPSESLSAGGVPTASLPSYCLIGQQSAPRVVQKSSTGSTVQSANNNSSGRRAEKTQLVIGKAAGKSVRPAQVFSLSQGSMLVLQPNPVTLNTGGHDVHISSGAIVYVAQVGDDTAVYNLGGERKESVSVESTFDKHTYNIPIGTALFVSNADKFDGSKLAGHITCFGPELIGTENGVHIYSADFSYLSALRKCMQVQDCLRSADKDEHALAEKLLKYSAAYVVAGP